MTLDWLLESNDNKLKKAEKNYLIGDVDDQKDSTAQKAAAPATASDKKRTASAAVDGVQRPSKKKRNEQKTEQKTEEKKIHVPVDEACKDSGKWCKFYQFDALWLIY